MATVAILVFTSQLVAYSVFYLFVYFVPPARALPFNAMLAAWGSVGAFTKGRLDAVVIPGIAFFGAMLAVASRGGSVRVSVQVLVAICASHVAHRLATKSNKLPRLFRIAVENTESVLPESWSSSLASITIGAILGAMPFFIIVLPVGIWMSFTEALLLYAAIGSLGACSQSILLASIWVIIIFGGRFGFTVDTVVYAGVAGLAILAGRGGTLILRSVDRRERPA